MFGLFGKKKAAPPVAPNGTPPATEPPAAPGWAAIDEAFNALYRGQVPRHLAPKGVRRMHDTRVPPENPLDGISVYDAGDHWHFVGYGLSDLYEKVMPGPQSGLGHELTLRVGKRDGEPMPPRWPIKILLDVAAMELGGSTLAAGQTVKYGPLDGQPETRLTALLVVEEPELPPRETPHGRLAFLLLVGLDAETCERSHREGSATVLPGLRAAEPALVTRP